MTAIYLWLFYISGVAQAQLPKVVASKRVQLTLCARGQHRERHRRRAQTRYDRHSRIGMAGTPSTVAQAQAGTMETGQTVLGRNAITAAIARSSSHPPPRQTPSQSTPCTYIGSECKRVVVARSQLPHRDSKQRLRHTARQDLGVGGVDAQLAVVVLPKAPHAGALHRQRRVVLPTRNA